MATMIPNDVEEFQTEGERVFFRFLQSVAKPDSRYVAWYLPDVNGKEPDFLLYGDGVCFGVEGGTKENNFPIGVDGRISVQG
jgi:hypothetical protein